MSGRHTAATSRIQARLERWELDHLRQHAADLAERLEAAEARAADLERQLSYAEDSSEFWREQAIQMQLDAAEEIGGAPGITMGGALVIAQMPEVRHV